MRFRDRIFRPMSYNYTFTWDAGVHDNSERMSVCLDKTSGKPSVLHIMRRAGRCRRRQWPQRRQQSPFWDRSCSAESLQHQSPCVDSEIFHQLCQPHLSLVRIPPEPHILQAPGVVSLVILIINNVDISKVRNLVEIIVQLLKRRILF